MAESYPSDAELWGSIKEDDDRAFTLLFKRYWQLLYKTALHYTSDQQLAEEIVHDLFVVLWNRRRHLQIVDFRSYLKAAARYEVLRQLKKKKAPVTFYDRLPERPELSAANNGDEHIRDLELENGLFEQLKKLPDRCREVFLLSRKDHLTNAEIALQLGISRRSVENQLTNALKFLRGNMKNLPLLLICKEFIIFVCRAKN